MSDPDQQPEPDGIQPNDEMAVRLASIDRQLAEFHQRAAHREAIIDRLHGENAELRLGVRRVVLEPVVVDLVRMSETLSREARYQSDDNPRLAKLLDALADDVALILDRCGYTIIADEIGQPVQRGRHSMTEIEPTEDRDRHNTVAAVLSPGLVDRDNDQPRRPAKVRVYRVAASVPATPASVETPEGE